MVREHPHHGAVTLVIGPKPFGRKKIFDGLAKKQGTAIGTVSVLLI
jgi:hypothetical protein